MAVQVPPRLAVHLAGALVVGAVVVADPSGLAPFGPAKWAVISTLGFATAAAALWWGRTRLHHRSLRAWGVLLGFFTLGTSFGGDVPTALLGQPDRHLGLITWVLFALLFLAGQQIVGADDRRSVMRASVVAALLLGAWCVWELVLGRPIDLDTNSRRLTGPFGSAAYLGAATTLLIPISLGMALDRTAHRRWRAVAGFAAVTATTGLVGSGSRAAWCAALVASVVVVIAVRPPVRRLLAIAAVAAIAVLLLAPRLGDVVDRSAGASSRLDEWAMATRVIASHPFVGVGPEGYRIAVSEGVDRSYERAYGRDRVLPDRAHSAPLDVALAGGLPAAAISVALVGFVCWRAVTLMRHRPALAGLGAGVVAYSLHQTLLFPLAELDPVWWLFAGIVVTARPEPRPMVHMRSRRIVGAGAAGVAVVALVAGILDVSADRLAKQSLATDDIDVAVSNAERAVRLRPDVVRYRMMASVVLAERGTLAGIDAAIEQAEAALRWSGDDPVALDRDASLLLDRAVVTGDPGDVAASFAAWRHLVERDPVRARWQLQLGRAAALAGDVETARAAWTAATDLSPDDPVPLQLLAGI